MRSTVRGLGVVGVGLLCATAASAQDLIMTGPVSSEAYVADPASQASPALVLPSGKMELGADVVLVTSGENVEGRKLDFTDVGLLRLRARRALGEWVEVFAATELLIKQRSDMHEKLWQGGVFGLRLPFGGKFAADLTESGGPLMGRGGWWWGFQPGLVGKFAIDDDTRFELGVFDTFTELELRPSTAQRFYVNEVGARVQLQVGDHHGGGWLGFDYHVPVASNPDDNAPDADTGEFLHPAVRLGVQVGGVVVLDEWNLFAIYSIVDRGELEHPETTLPILNGGFDQTQICFGVQRRFGDDDHGE
jgi:hypothetical protein